MTLTPAFATTATLASTAALLAELTPVITDQDWTKYAPTLVQHTWATVGTRIEGHRADLNPNTVSANVCDYVNARLDAAETAMRACDLDVEFLGRFNAAEIIALEAACTALEEAAAYAHEHTVAPL